MSNLPSVVGYAPLNDQVTCLIKLASEKIERILEQSPRALDYSSRI